MRFRYSPQPDATELFETKSVWNGPRVRRSYACKCHCGHAHRHVYYTNHSPGKWVCKHCGADKQMKYIATGHDHTDYSYEVCGCDGARKHGKPERLLN